MSESSHATISASYAAVVAKALAASERRVGPLTSPCARISPSTAAESIGGEVLAIAITAQ